MTDAQPADEPPDKEPSTSEAGTAPPPAVSDPAKLIRLGTMVQTLMAEVRGAETDEEGRRLLARIHRETMEELATVLSPDLMDELTEFSACCGDDGVPSESEIRVAQAQLVGWLQGLLQGMQASFMAQQAVAATQMAELQSGRPDSPAAPPPGLSQQSGTYL
jgi:hypothetical protein